MWSGMAVWEERVVGVVAFWYLKIWNWAGVCYFVCGCELVGVAWLISPQGQCMTICQGLRWFVLFVSGVLGQG